MATIQQMQKEYQLKAIPNVPKKPGATAASKYGSKPAGWTPSMPGLGFDYKPGGILTDPGVNPVTKPSGTGTAQGAVTLPPSWQDFVKNQINNDASYVGTVAEGDRQIQAGQTAFQEALRRAFIELGAGDTSKLGEWAKYIDPATIEAAKQNKMSVISQNLAAMNKSLRRQRASLAARGMLSSGQTTQDTKEALAAREAADYGGFRGFANAGEQGLQSLAQLRASVNERLLAAQNAAADRAAQMYPGMVSGQGDTQAQAAATPAKLFGGIVGTKKLANGGTVVTYANGRQVQTNPNGTKYVIKQGA